MSRSPSPRGRDATDRRSLERVGPHAGIDGVSMVLRASSAFFGKARSIYVWAQNWKCRKSTRLERIVEKQFINMQSAAIETGNQATCDKQVVEDGLLDDADCRFDPKPSIKAAVANVVHRVQLEQDWQVLPPEDVHEKEYSVRCRLPFLRTSMGQLSCLENMLSSFGYCMST